MQFQAPISIKPLPESLHYHSRTMLVGSCFTEHIGNHLAEAKLNVLQNPHGILFDPLSVANSLLSYINNEVYKDNELFYLNETWNSWAHHSRFSNPDKDACLQHINASQQAAHQFLKTADWLVITLGSSFSYQLLASNNLPVANCHKAAAPLFKKHLCTIEETVTAIDGMLYQLFRFNPRIKIIFTISPVRHLRDGVVDNNRSKARLIEAVHHLVNKFDKLFYFPAYELIIDVLRDYRFYDIDLAHPNYMGTQYVLTHFVQYAMQPETIALMEEIKQINIAKKHRSSNPNSQLHKKFLATNLAKILQIQGKYPSLNFTEEIEYFSNT